MDEVPAGGVATIRAGDEETAPALLDGRPYATQDACVHLHGPLGEGWLDHHPRRENGEVRVAA